MRTITLSNRQVPRYEWMVQFGHSVESLHPTLRHARNKTNADAHVAEVMHALTLLKEALR